MDKDIEVEVLKAYCDLQWKAIREATDNLAKGGTFYLAIAAAITGYVLTQDLPQELRRLALVLGLALSIFAAA